MQRGNLDDRTAANALVAVIRSVLAIVASIAVVMSRICSAPFAARVLLCRMFDAAALAAIPTDQWACKNACGHEDI
jgi:hypothetical protein